MRIGASASNLPVAQNSGPPRSAVRGYTFYTCLHRLVLRVTFNARLRWLVLREVLHVPSPAGYARLQCLRAYVLVLYVIFCMSLRLRTGSLPVDPARDSEGGAFGGLCWPPVTLLLLGSAAGICSCRACGGHSSKV